MKILVSGGSGYVGRFIVENLAGAGHEVVVAGRARPDGDSFSAPVQFAELVLDPDADQSVRFGGADAFVHAAFDHIPGRYRGGEGDDAAGFRRRNLDGSIALFGQAKAAGVGRIVFLSSRAVYDGQPAGTVLRETLDPRPDTLYGQVKHEAEQALAAMAGEGLAATSLRVTGVYGPAGPGREDKWTPMIRDWLAGGIVAPRAGTEVHGRDLAHAVLIALGRNPVPPVLNVSDLVVDSRDVLAIAAETAGRRLALPEPGKAGNTMDTALLRSLGWTPGGHTLLKETVAALTRRLPGL